MSSWRQGTARGLLQKRLLQRRHCASCRAARWWQSDVLSLFLLQLPPVNCCFPLLLSATVRELLQICCSNAATAPTAAPPGDGRVTPFPFLLLQLPLVDCRFLFVFLGNKASPNMAAATPPLRQLPGDGRVMPFFLYLLQLPPVN